MYPLKVKIKWTINSYVSNKIQNFQWPKNQCAFVKDVRVTVKNKIIFWTAASQLLTKIIQIGNVSVCFKCSVFSRIDSSDSY